MNPPPDYRRAYYQLRRGEEVTDKHLLTPLKELPFRNAFKFSIDTEEVKKAVVKHVEFLKEVFDRQFVRFEHIGSTSMKGMPGTAMPDLIVYIDPFPPSNESLAKLEENEIKFLGIPPHSTKKGDMFFLRQSDEPIPDNDYSNVVLHLVSKDSDDLDHLIKFRNLVNSNPKVFDEYKKHKLAEYDDPNIQNMLEYKILKGKKIDALLEEFS